MKILDKSLTGVSAAEPVIQLGEKLDCSAEPSNVRRTDAWSVCMLPAYLLPGIYQPAERGIVPCSRL